MIAKLHTRYYFEKDAYYPPKAGLFETFFCLLWGLGGPPQLLISGIVCLNVGGQKLISYLDRVSVLLPDVQTNRRSVANYIDVVSYASTFHNADNSTGREKTIGNVQI